MTRARPPVSANEMEIMTTPAPATSRNPALVLIHGAVLNGGMWSPIVADLAADFQTVTPDMPGHGARMSEPFRLDRAVAVVQETVAALAPAPVVLVGDSLGSYVSIAAAGSLGSQVKGAVLGGGTGNFQGPVGLACAVQIWLTNRIPPAKLQAKL